MKSYLILVLAVASLAGCHEKETDILPNPLEKVLISGNSKWEQYGLAIIGDTSTNWDCYHYQLYKFNANHSYTFKYRINPYSCDSADGQWHLNGNKLILTANPISDTLQVVHQAPHLRLSKLIDTVEIQMQFSSVE